MAMFRQTRGAFTDARFCEHKINHSIFSSYIYTLPLLTIRTSFLCAPLLPTLSNLSRGAPRRAYRTRIDDVACDVAYATIFTCRGKSNATHLIVRLHFVVVVACLVSVSRAGAFSCWRVSTLLRAILHFRLTRTLRTSCIFTSRSRYQCLPLSYFRHLRVISCIFVRRPRVPATPGDARRHRARTRDDIDHAGGVRTARWWYRVIPAAGMVMRDARRGVKRGRTRAVSGCTSRVWAPLAHAARAPRRARASRTYILPTLACAWRSRC